MPESPTSLNHHSWTLNLCDLFFVLVRLSAGNEMLIAAAEAVGSAAAVQLAGPDAVGRLVEAEHFDWKEREYRWGPRLEPSHPRSVAVPGSPSARLPILVASVRLLLIDLGAPASVRLALGLAVP